MPEDKVEEYLKESERLARTAGTARKAMIGSALQRIWKSMTVEEQLEVQRRWKDPQ